MVQGLIFGWFLTHNPKRPLPLRALFLFCFLPLAFILAKTASRAAFLAFALTLPFVFSRYSVRGKAAALLAVSIGAIGGFAIMPESSQRRVFTVFQVGKVEGELSENEVNVVLSAQGSARQRLELLKTSLLFTIQNPILGVGPGQFAAAEDKKATALGRPRGVWLGTHNTYTEISSEAGIPALLFYVACMVVCWKELRWAERFHSRNLFVDSAQWAAAGFTLRLSLINYAIFYFFEHIAYSPFLPSLAGLIFAYSTATRRLVVETAQQRPPAPAAPAPVPAPPPIPSR
jgi:O-antigen ligase